MSAFLQTQRPGAPKPSPSKRGARKRRLSAGSLNGDDNNNNVHKEEEGSGGEDNDGQGGKKKAGMKAGAGGEVTGGGGPVEHKYQAEIAQMVYVFGEIQSPAEESVHLIEDMVRSQMIELATRARTISYLRNARYLTIEDVIYLIRDDRARVNRLRTYLSWKEVRKTARKEESSATKGGADVEIEDLEDDLVEKKAPRKEVIKLPWEPLTPFAEVLKNLPGRQNGAAPDEEEDDDELEAYEDSLQRLREADSVTRRMSKEQYVFYSECRQASFTYRKAKRFRDFLNTTAYLDLKPNEDVMDVLGFLAFESVRSLCVAALEIRDAAAGVKRIDLLAVSEASRPDAMEEEGTGQAEPMQVDGKTDEKPVDETDDEPNQAENMVSTPEAKMEQDSTSKTTPAKPRAKSPPPEPWKAPPTLPLLPAHLLTAYSRLQRGQATKKAGGLRNWRGGVKRTKIALI